MNKKVNKILAATLSVLFMSVFPLATAFAAPTTTEYPVTTNSDPYGITTGPDGNLWFTQENTNKIVKMTTSGVMTSFTVPTSHAYPQKITSGPDGNLWFTEETSAGNKIGKITTSGTITEYPLSTPTSAPEGITAGPDGNVWFVERLANQIGMITPSGSITEYSIPTANASPYSITSGPDGNLWFTENGSGGKIGKITTSGTITEYSSSTGGAMGIARGPDGNLWFTSYNNNKIGKITTTGSVTLYNIPTANSYPWDITPGPDGNLWFVEAVGNAIARVSTSGQITEYPLPSISSVPMSITNGPDDHLWFTETSGSRVGELTPPPAAPLNLSGATPTKTPTLSWLASPGAATYDIYRDSAKIGSTTSLSYSDTSAPSGLHNYSVTAVNSEGESTFSNGVSLLVDKTKPTVSFTSPTSFTGPFSPGPVVSIVASDSDSGLQNMVIHVYDSGNNLIGVCGSATPGELASKTMSCNLSSLASGSYTVRGGATDNAGNIEVIVSPVFTIL